MPSLQQTLRDQTAASHAALERTTLMAAFSAEQMPVAVYGRYLQLQWRLHAPLERALAPWLPPEAAALRLRKCEWLLQDLQALGESPAEPLAAPGTVTSWAQALGVLYVLEGSTLGLQVVRKQAQQQHPALQQATRFMLGYGPDTGRRWREFLAQLEALEEAGWPAAAAAAVSTFDHFLQGFSGASLETPAPGVRSS